MSDIQLFRINNGKATELAARAVALERELQGLVEGQMENLLGVRFLASEYATGKTHRGRIDSLGLDENGCPVIVEYKRQSNENVINQGLFYLDWLLDHQAEFRWLVMEKLGKDVADQIEWSGTRLLCIAADFTRYDQYAVQQIPRNIELIRYRLFGADLLLLELVNAQTVADVTAVQSTSGNTVDASAPKVASRDKTLLEQLDQASPEVRAVYEEAKAFMLALGEDVQEKQLKQYTAFKRLKNFTCVVVQANRLLLILKLDPDTVEFKEGFCRDVSKISKWGTGDVEISVRSSDDFNRAKPLIERSYAEN